MKTQQATFLKIMVVFLVSLPLALPAAGCNPIEVRCPDDFAKCDGKCIGITSNHRHCGRCGSLCGDDEICSDGACIKMCGFLEIADRNEMMDVLDECLARRNPLENADIEGFFRYFHYGGESFDVSINEVTYARQLYFSSEIGSVDPGETTEIRIDRHCDYPKIYHVSNAIAVGEGHFKIRLDSVMLTQPVNAAASYCPEEADGEYCMEEMLCLSGECHRYGDADFICCCSEVPLDFDAITFLPHPEVCRSDATPCAEDVYTGYSTYDCYEDYASYADARGLDDQCIDSSGQTHIGKICSETSHGTTKSGECDARGHCDVDWPNY